MIFFFITVIIISLTYTLSFKKNLKRFLISFWILSVFIYSYTGIPQIVFDGVYQDSAEKFLLFTSFSIISALLGFRFSEKININYLNRIFARKNIIRPNINSLFIIIFLLVITNYSYFKLMPSFGEMFTYSRYQYIKEFDNPNSLISVMNLVLSGFLSALGTHISFNMHFFKSGFLGLKHQFINFINLRLSKRYILYLIILFFTIILLAYLVARGDRNPILILILPFLASRLNIENIKKSTLILFFIFAVIIAQFLDILRAITFGTLFNIILGNQIEKNIVFPINDLLLGSGEFITPLKTFDIYLNNKFDFDSIVFKFPGFSYILGIPLNFLRTLGLADNGLTLAGRFSNIFGSRGMGLGFSHQLEAYINFGWLGAFVPYFLIGLFIGLISRLVSYGNIFWRSIYYTFIPIMINMQRIDMAVSMKLFFYSSVGIVLYYSINLRSNMVIEKDYQDSLK